MARACGLFTTDEMEFFAADIHAFFDSDEENGKMWLVDEDDGTVLAAAYLAAEMADRVWNLLFIAVRPDLKGKGRGGALLQHVEAMLEEQGQRMLVIDTSGLPEFEPTRRFYLKHDYDLAAEIPDYWTDGDAKIVFVKRLNTPA